MKTFLEFITESSAPGNYIAMTVTEEFTNLSAALNDTHSGIYVPLDRRHVTLMYSPNTSIEPVTILNVLRSEFPDEFAADAVQFACFDALPKDGERDSTTGTLVVKLESPLLEQIHSRLIELGCRHTYQTYSAHVSLHYDMDLTECQDLVETLNSTVEFPFKIKLASYTSEQIVENWQSTLLKQ